jgi:hypothetical protein
LCQRNGEGPIGDANGALREMRKLVTSPTVWWMLEDLGVAQLHH